MKIALCLSGQPRFFNKGFDFINKFIITPNNITDIFCHFWFNEDDIGKIGFDNTSRTLSKENYRNDVIHHNTIDQIYKIYQPKKMMYEKQYDCNNFILRDYSTRSNLTNPFATFSQYLSTHKTILLKEEFEKENNFQYNIVIKCRYDFKIDREIVVSNYENNHIIFHNDVDRNDKIIVNDGMFFGNSNLMCEMLKNAYLNFDTYWVNNTNLLWDNHDLLGEYLNINNVPFDKVFLGNIKWIRN